jgi:hypothetical protein
MDISAIRSSYALLELLLGGHILSHEELDILLSKKIREDLYLDYKHGDELKKPDPAKTLREYMTAFANSAGGVLIIGVSNTYQVTGCKAPGGHPVDEWASRCLQDLHYYFSPPPRFHRIEYPIDLRTNEQKVVLVAAVDRSMLLIPLRQGRNQVYYLRFHDQTSNTYTLQAPEYLINDILLGRRNVPLIKVNPIMFSSIGFYMDNNTGNNFIQCGIKFDIENISFVWGKDARIGCLYINANHEGTGYSEYLKSFITMLDVPPSLSKLHRSWVNRYKAIGDIKPFQDLHVVFENIMIPSSVVGCHDDYLWKAAVYVISENTPPLWYQVTVRIDVPLRTWVASSSKTTPNRDIIVVEQVSAGFPEVGWALAPVSA